MECFDARKRDFSGGQGPCFINAHDGGVPQCFRRSKMTDDAAVREEPPCSDRKRQRENERQIFRNRADRKRQRLTKHECRSFPAKKAADKQESACNENARRDNDSKSTKTTLKRRPLCARLNDP